MGSAGGGRINKPKAAVSRVGRLQHVIKSCILSFNHQFCKKDVRKETKMKIKALKRLTARGHSEHTLESTTKDMLRQTRYIATLLSCNVCLIS